MTRSAAFVRISLLAEKQGVKIEECAIGEFRDGEGDLLVRLDPPKGESIRVYFDQFEGTELVQ